MRQQPEGERCSFLWDSPLPKIVKKIHIGVILSDVKKIPTMHFRLVLTSFSLPFKFVHFFQKREKWVFEWKDEECAEPKNLQYTFCPRCCGLPTWYAMLKQSITDYGLCVIR